MNSSSVSVSWDSAQGEFDFHRVTVANGSVTSTLTIPKEERVAVVTGLVDGCSYNVSAERVRGATAGSAASLNITTGRQNYRSTGWRLVIINCPGCFVKLIFLPSLSVISASPRTRHACAECVCACILAALGAGIEVCGSLPGPAATEPWKSHSAPCTWWIHSGTHTHPMKWTLLDSLTRGLYDLTLSPKKLNSPKYTSVTKSTPGFVGLTAELCYWLHKLPPHFSLSWLPGVRYPPKCNLTHHMHRAHRAKSWVIDLIIY